MLRFAGVVALGDDLFVGAHDDCTHWHVPLLRRHACVVQGALHPLLHLIATGPRVGMNIFQRGITHVIKRKRP